MTKFRGKYIDLFAGCGGLSLGLLSSQKWDGIFAIEKNHDAFLTLQSNLINKFKHFTWPTWLPIKNLDIEEVLDNYSTQLLTLKGQVDLVAGGPPCQGFSLAGRRNEFDIRNGLAKKYIDFIKIVEPSIVFFENVIGFNIGFKNSNGIRSEAYSNIVLKELQSIGYDDATYRIIDFSQYGVPQKRRRIIIIASKNNLANDFFNNLELQRDIFLKQKGISAKTTLYDAISDLEKANGTIPSPDSKNFLAGIYSELPKSEYQILMRKNITSEVVNSHRFANHKEETLLKFSSIQKNNLSSREITDIFKTKKTSTVLLKDCCVTSTLTTLPDDFIHYSEPRILTVREYARIQSFPDWFEFKGKYTTGGKVRKQEVPRYSQVGNAIPPLFAELAGKIIWELTQK